MASKDRDAVRAQQERVQSLLIDTVTLLCKNSIQYEDELKVEGLLGITVDKEVFLVNISEKFQEEKEEEPEPEPDPVEKASPRGTKRSHDMSPAPSPTKQSSRVDQVKVKTEVTDDDEDIVIVKDEGIRPPTGERRVPPLHGASDDYNYSMDYGYGPDSGGGEPPTKQRRSGPGQSFHSGDSSHSSDSFMDPNFANLAAQVSQEVTGDGSFDAGGNWQPQPGTSQGNMFICDHPTCGKHYKTLTSYRYHMKNSHGRGSQGYECMGDPSCQRRFNHLISLQRHQVTAHGFKLGYREVATGRVSAPPKLGEYGIVSSHIPPGLRIDQGPGGLEDMAEESDKEAEEGPMKFDGAENIEIKPRKESDQEMSPDMPNSGESSDPEKC